MSFNGYFDYDEYDFAQDYALSSPRVSVATVTKERGTGQCDRCRLLPGEAVTVDGLTVVCACWVGQGSTEDACECGPEEGAPAGDGVPD